MRAVFLSGTMGHSRGHATRDGVNLLATTGGGPTALSDSASLPPGGASQSTGKGQWIWTPAMASGQQKRIVGGAVPYNASTFTLSHLGPVYDSTTIAALIAGTPYMVLRDDPDYWVGAFNEAMRTITTNIMFSEFTPTGVVKYAVASAPISVAGITRRTQILDVETHDIGDASGYEHWRPWADGRHVWEPVVSDGAVYLDFKDPNTAPGTGDRMRIKWGSQVAVPTTDTESVEIDELQAALATLVVMADQRADTDNPNDDWMKIGQRARIEYEAWRRLNLGPDAYRQVIYPQQETGYAGVAGRGGRRR